MICFLSFMSGKEKMQNADWGKNLAHIMCTKRVRVDNMSLLRRLDHPKELFMYK